MPFKKVDAKDESIISREWDELAPIRYEQIISGNDVTYNSVLAPQIVDLIAANNPARALDVGCGVGILSARVADLGIQVVAIDPSAASIEIAKNRFGRQVDFHQQSIERYADGLSKEMKFDVAFANMVLMDVLKLDTFLAAISASILDGGHFVFSLTHPCFWPEYYGYASESWFNYNQQIIIEAPFRTSLAPDGTNVSTHVHRPLAAYINALEASDLQVQVLREPLPNSDVMLKYPCTWKHPRYLFGVCQKRI